MYVVPHIEELPNNLDPIEVLKQFSHFPHPILFHSADQSSSRGHYSFFAADPVIWKSGRFDDGSPFNPFDDLKPLIASGRKLVAGLPPFQGGIAGLFGYELNHLLERLPTPQIDEFGMPSFAIGLYPWVISWDHEQKRTWLISQCLDQDSASTWEARTRRVLNQLQQHVSLPQPIISAQVDLQQQFATPYGIHVTSNLGQEGYREIVRRGVEYIHAGDCFQINLAHRLTTPARCHPIELYAKLSKCNPAPFSAYLDLGSFQIISASPERFLEVRDGIVETRPIKGTRKRSRDPVEDQQLIEDLINNPKDRAENVMIVDLLRNDLGKACQYRSITVPEVCKLETYETVHHLVSAVRGKLRPDQTALDLLRHTFPGGSITGAPKVRAMEIIAELEPTVRGPYCGCLAYFGFDGGMDSSILIRTFTQGKGWLQFPVGCGIVADSNPDSEYEETLHKAAGLIRALQ
jgi:para-aminobenzoate synthetase component I